MKKILSILICLVLGISSAWAAAKITINSTCNPTNGGVVAVQTKTSTGANWSGSIQWPNSWNNQNYGEAGAHKASISTRTVGIRYMVTATANAGFYFVEFDGLPVAEQSWKGDYDSETIYNDITENPYDAITKYVTSNTTYNVIANFKPVAVDAVSPSGIVLNSTDKLGFAETTITFTVTGADNMNDFVSDKVVLSGDSRFTIQSTNLSGNTVKVVVRFTDDNHHVIDGTLPQATVTLTSKGDNASKKTATITATSDLTPKITITPSPCDLTPDSPVAEGNTVSDTLTASAATGYANVCGEATWSAAFSDPEEAERMGYSADFSNPKIGIPVSFTPTVYSINQANVETYIRITTTYTDGSPKVITNTDSVVISADAGKVITIDGLTEAVMDFGIIDYTDTNISVTQEFPVFSTLPAGNFNFTASDFNSNIVYANNFKAGSTSATDNVSVTVTVDSTLVPGDYQPNLTYTENVAQDPISASMDVKVSIKLAKPVVTTEASTGRVYLSWNEVYGATKYKVWSGNVVVTDTIVAGQSSYKYEVSQINGVSLENFIQYPFEVEAVYADDHVGNRKSDIVYETPGLPGEIRIDNVSGVEIFTGTEGYSEGDPTYGVFPYTPKRKVSLEHVFDTVGNPLFDELYIFGLTTNTVGGTEINAPSAIVACNAKTPCYVYVKKGNVYKKDSEFDATCTRFDHGTSKNKKHLYFTGYCPFAYMGVSSTEDGWMYFKGGNTRVDLYLDSCQIMGRYKTPTGQNSGYNPYTLELRANVDNLGADNPNISFIAGVSSPFVFTSTTKQEGESYKPHIHIAGKNHLKGQLGSYITKTMGIIRILFFDYEIDAGIENIYTYNAPITIKPTDVGQFTDLVMDDVWKDGSITNGYLWLDSERGDSPSEKVVAVDLGSANGTLTINGGQYHMRNSAADGTYACNLAVGYRMFSKLVQKEVASVNVDCLLHLYGFGGDMTDSKVTINSGTFTMYKNMYPSAIGGYLGEGYYKDQINFLDLRLPAGNGYSRINGGTFNGISNVLMCNQVTSTGASPKNGYGDWLCLQEFEVTEEKQRNGSVNFTFPELYIADVPVYDNPQVVYDITDATVNSDVVRGFLYGGQSVNTYVKDGKCYVNLLLAGEAYSKDGYCPECNYQDEAIIFQWATTLPMMSASKEVAGQMQAIQIGGASEVKVKPSDQQIKYQTNQLMYMDLEGLEPYSLMLANGAGIGFYNVDSTRGQFTNTGNYEILKHLNLLKTVQADTWYAFTAPFNIHDVSVLEMSNEKKQEKMSRADALKQQAVDNLSLLYEVQNFIIPNEEGRASSLTFREMISFNNGPTVYPLIHYNDSNIMTANYYLYELDPDSLNTEGEFGTDATGTSLNIDWTPVKRNPGEPIMYKGETYAMQFPFCPMCNDLESRKYYDYWSNKMILFHGNGPQEIFGKDVHNVIKRTSVSSGFATLVGNSTFADMTNVTGYVHKDTTLEETPGDWFVYEEGATVKPTQGYLLYNGGRSGMPTRISRSGEMIYDNNSPTSIDGIPTIADRSALMIFDAIDGFNILSLREQMVTVYNLQGHVIFHQYMSEGQQIHIATAPGVYVVKGESETIKVMVE